jgi:tetratricopeptide (TPR) repeat protein
MSESVGTLMKRAQEARRERRGEDARRDLIAAVEMARSAEHRGELAQALTGLGQIERDAGNYDAARAHYEEAAEIYRMQGEPQRLAHALRHIGDILQDQGRGRLGEAYVREALELYRADTRTAPLDLANAIRGLAVIKQGLGASGQARALWVEAKDLYASVGVDAGVRESEKRIAELGPHPAAS